MTRVDPDPEQPSSQASVAGRPVLDELTRKRLGEQMRALYDPVIEEQLDTYMVELLQRLAADE